jgi:hypothetical protein
MRPNAFREENMTSTATHTMTREMQECIDNCTRCHAICLETVDHCLHLGGKHADAHHITLLLDCAEICQTSANFMLRGSDQHAHICAACAEICRRCEEACRSMGSDEMMRQCAEICARCADSCERMASSAH